jgi:hypothetical protein
MYIPTISPHLRHKTLGNECINLQSLIGSNVIMLIQCQQIIFLDLISLWRTHLAGSALIRSWWHVQDLRIRMHDILVISFTRIWQCGQSIASIRFFSWWFCEIRLHNGVHSHSPGLGTDWLWTGVHFSRYVRIVKISTKIVWFRTKDLAASCKLYLVY